MSLKPRKPKATSRGAGSPGTTSSLPEIATRHALPPGQQRVLNAEPPLAARPKVLLVDDDRRTLEGLRLMLRREPFELVFATSAAEARAILERLPVDVIVSDEKMPGMSGLEFLAGVRRAFPRIARIVLTGDVGLDVAARATMDAQLFGFLTKPCVPGSLASMIRDAMSRRETRAAT
jgi:DNA-binding NtrC family response regulator